MKIEHWNAERDGPLTEAALRRQREARGYRVTRYVYAPGTNFPPHAHDCDKIDAVLSGRFRVMVAIPRGVVHDARVVGDEPVVSLDAIRIG